MGRGHNCICPPGYWGEWWEKQQNPQGSQWKTCRPWWHLGVTRFQNAPSEGTSITTASLEGLPEESLFWPQDTEESAWSLPNVIYIMTGTRCSGQMRPKLICFCQVQHLHVWRRNRDAYKEKHLIPTVKYGGGSVIFCGCFNCRVPGSLVRIDGIMNSTKYQAILAENLVPSARRLGRLSKKTMTQSIPQDPYRNGSVTTKSTFCNGHLSHQLKRSVDKNKPKNVKDLERICKEKWPKIPPNVLTLTLSKKRLHAVILARGGCPKC